MWIFKFNQQDHLLWLSHHIKNDLKYLHWLFTRPGIQFLQERLRNSILFCVGGARQFDLSQEVHCICFHCLFIAYLFYLHSRYLYLLRLLFGVFLSDFNGVERMAVSGSHPQDYTSAPHCWNLSFSISSTVLAAVRWILGSVPHPWKLYLDPAVPPSTQTYLLVLGTQSLVKPLLLRLWCLCYLY